MNYTQNSWVASIANSTASDLVNALENELCYWGALNGQDTGEPFAALYAARLVRDTTDSTMMHLAEDYDI